MSPAVVVPSLMILHKQEYGIRKGIPTTLIAASSFDDIIAITVFSVFLSIGLNSAPRVTETDVLDPVIENEAMIRMLESHGDADTATS